jgi:pimeloyl-ACP methyl ester carboxylesterase
LPEQVPVTEGRAKLPGTTLWYWDTGGKGPVVILLHAASGSGAFWGYQQPVLAKAGFRVISYSRRGYLKSDPGDPNDPGTACEDLHHLVGFLGVDTFHAVGLAAGGIVGVDYALSHPERLRSLTLASTIMGVTDKPYLDLCSTFRPAFFAQLPKDFQELSATYRAGNPEGAAAWATQPEERQRHHLGKGRDHQAADPADDGRCGPVDAAVDPAPAGEPREARRGEGDRGGGTCTELGAAGGLQRDAAGLSEAPLVSWIRNSLHRCRESVERISDP